MQRRGVSFVAFALASCAQDGSVEPRNPDLNDEVSQREGPDRTTGESQCEHESLFGHTRTPKRMKMPGPISALVTNSRAVWVCGEDRDGKGYLVQIESAIDGGPIKTTHRVLASPCRGLTPRGAGLALWLDGGQGLWLANPQDLTFNPPVTKLADRLDQSRPIRAVRAIWSDAHQSFFRVSENGVILRVSVQADKLVLDPVFKSPAKHALDIAQVEATLMIADAQQGVLAWNPNDAEIQARWPQAQGASQLRSHGSVSRVTINEKGRVFAASSTSLIELRWSPKDAEFNLVSQHPIFEPPLDLINHPRGPFTLTSTRLWLGPSLMHQRFPELEQRPSMVSMTQGPDGHLWVAADETLEILPLPSKEPHARVVPLASHATLTSTLSDSSQAEIPFLVEGQGALWFKAPDLSKGDGIVIDPPHWPQPDPRCPELYRVQAPARLSISLRAAHGTQRPRQARVELISSDPERGQLSFPVDIDATPLEERVGLQLPEPSLIDLSHGTYAQVQARGAWHWIEFIPAKFSQQNQAGLQQLARFAQTQRRNNRPELVVSVILGGSLRTLPEIETRALRLFLDERHTFHRALSRTANGRFYPLRLLVDPQGRLAYADQHIGLANAIARYRERER